MKDRVSGSGGYSTANGAKRYGVYASASATTPTSYEFLLLEDNPSETGTALSKANLLADATGTKYGLGDTGTPNDVFNKLIYTDLTVATGWSTTTLSGSTVYYKDITASGSTTTSKPMLVSVMPTSSAVTKSAISTARKDAAKIFGYDNAIEAGKIRLYAYENITSSLVARFTNI